MRKLLLLRALGGLSEWLLGERTTDTYDAANQLLHDEYREGWSLEG